MIRRLLLPLLLLMIAGTNPAWSTNITVSSGTQEDRISALRSLADIVLQQTRSPSDEIERRGARSTEPSLANLASQISITDVPELLRALSQGRAAEFGELSNSFRELVSSSGIEQADASQLLRNCALQSDQISIDATLLDAISLRVEQMLSTATDQATTALLMVYVQQIKTVRDQLNTYQNEVDKIAKVVPKLPQKTSDNIADKIKTTAEEVDQIRAELNQLNSEIARTPAGKRTEDQYQEAISRLLKLLQNLNGVEELLSQLLGRSLTASEMAALHALQRQIDGMQSMLATSLRDASNAAQIAAEMRRQEMLAREQPLGQYSYLSWGVWGSEAMLRDPAYQNSHWVAGRLTPAAAIPTTGTASYSGQVVGQLNEGGAATTVSGTSSITAIFDNRGITGSFDNMKRANGTAWTSATVSGNWAAGTNQITGTVNAANGMTGTVNGSFFGPAANHIGGSWGLSGGGNQASGVFVGDKQPPVTP